MTSPQKALTKIFIVFIRFIKVYIYFKVELSGILYLNSERLQILCLYSRNINQIVYRQRKERDTCFFKNKEPLFTS